MSDKRALMSVETIATMLAEHAPSICHDLFPHVKNRSRERFTVGDLDGNPGQSLSIYFGGAKPGAWRDFSSDEKGDILDLVAKVRFNGDKRSAVQWAIRYLGIDPAAPEPPEQKRQREERQKQRQREADAAQEKRVSIANWIYLSARPQLAGSPVEHYLASRGIAIARFPSLGAIRFQPDCLRHDTGELLPAMVACMVGRDGKIHAVHRTYLEERDGRWQAIRYQDHKGRWRKLKLTLGDVQGAYISLQKGASGVPLGRAPEGDRVLISEGIETGLSYALACPDLRVIAAASISNIANVPLPATIRTRFLVQEADTHPKAIAAFARAVEAHTRQCDDVRIVPPIAGFKDANDVLQGRRVG